MSGILERVRSMDARELRFRVVTESRRRIERARSAIRPLRWRRHDLRLHVTSAEVREARRALAAGRWHDAHRALARHYASRTSLSMTAATLPEIATAVTRRFPGSAADAAERAARMRGGRYDLLGYRDVAAGSPPAWHHDPVHDRTAPRLFWSSVPYLDPACGDHKIIWELNRHQHWLGLIRSRALNADRGCYEEFVAQLESWMAANPPLQGVNWASMLELAFRSISWIVALQAFAGDAVEDEPTAPAWTVDLLLGLDRQLSHAARNLSTYFSPNTHLSGEALALYVAGRTVPELPSSRRFGAMGRAILLREIERQVGADGLHAELSAHYHRYSTDFYLLALVVARATGDAAATEFEQAARRQARALRSLADDRGMLPLLGDDDGGQLFPICGPNPIDASATLQAAAVLVGEPELAAGEPREDVWWFAGLDAGRLADRGRPARWASTALAAGGYFIARDRAGNHLVADAGRHGFLNGGHAHADALSVVVSVRSTPLLIDPGTATYTMDPPVRDRFRSTPMHNTVALDGRSQSEPAGPFHWRTRANARPHAWHTGNGFAYFEASHDGYAPTRHTRAILALDEIGWLVIDRLDGAGSVCAEAFWHLHPAWTPSAVEHGVVQLVHVDGLRSALATTASNLRILGPNDPSGLSAFAPVYGRVVSASTLVAEARCALPHVVATFIAADPWMAAGVRIRQLAIECPPEDAWSAVAVSIDAAGGRVTALVALDGAREPVPDSGPPADWGAAGIRTTGRAAVVIERDLATRAILVSGRSLTIDGDRILDHGADRASGSAAVPSAAAVIAASRSWRASSCVE